MLPYNLNCEGADNMAKKAAASKARPIQIAASPELRERWEAVRTATGHKTLAPVLEALIDAFETGRGNDSGEFDALAQFLGAEATELGLPLNVVIGSAIAAVREKANTEGQGVAKINAAVREIMRGNAAAGEWYERTAITGAGIHTITGSNQQSIRKWLNENATIVDAHHAAMGIDDPSDHNRRAERFKRTGLE